MLTKLPFLSFTAMAEDDLYIERVYTVLTNKDKVLIIMPSIVLFFAVVSVAFQYFISKRILVDHHYSMVLLQETFMSVNVIDCILITK